MPIASLEKAERIERAVEGLYRRLAAKLREHELLAKVLEGLADEEAEHAQRIAMLRYQVEGDPRLAARITLDEKRLDSLLFETEVIASKIVQSAFTAAAALQLAGELERTFADVHADCAADSDAWLRDFFADLAADDHRHQELLDEWTRTAGHVNLQ